MKTPRATTTLGDLHRATPWLWLHCEKCHHYAPLACAAPVIRWGAETSSDKTQAMRALHRLREQGRDDPASGLGWRRCWLSSISKRVDFKGLG